MDRKMDRDMGTDIDTNMNAVEIRTQDGKSQC
jgi:hypothetical protein